MGKTIGRLILLVVLTAAALFLLIQAVPFGRAHTNPPVVKEPNWDSPRTREIAKRACFDCHSNETTWPAYSNVAPVSWLVQRDVNEGRSKLNFSDWRGVRENEDVGEVVLEGEMPPAIYLITHPEARLSAQEKQDLAAGLERTIQSSASE